MPESTKTRRTSLGLVATVGGILAALVWSIVRAGTTVSPGLGDAHNAALIWPEVPSGEFSSFYADSALGILIYRGLSLESEKSFLWLSSVTALLAVVALAGWAYWAAPGSQKARAARLMILAPLPAVLFNWLGFYDSYTALAWAAVLWAWASRSRLLLSIAGVLVGLQHFEQGLLGLAALTLIWFAVRDHLPAPLRERTPLWSLIGLVIGKGILVVTLVLNGSELSGRTSGVSAYYREWFITAVNTGPVLLWALFAGSWAVVIGWWLLEAKQRNRVLLVGAIAIGVAAMLISGDRPRVFIMIIAPMLLVLTIAFLARKDTSPKALIAVETIVWVGAPIALWGPKVVNSNALDHLIMTFGSLTG